MDQTIKHRINTGRVALKEQIDFFHAQLGQVESEWKEDDTRVTFADFAISEKILATLRKSFPSDDFCSEESNPEDEVQLLQNKYAWVIDPIDGTNNYALGLPICGISLALLKNGTPVYGFLYDATRRKLIQGGPGYGLYDGCQRVELKDSGLGSQSVLGMHFPVTGEQYRKLEKVMTGYRLRCLGSGALNLGFTAIGLLDGCLDYRVKVWDIAAGHALIRAAGSEILFLENNPFPLSEFHVRMPFCPYIAGSKKVVQELLKLTDEIS